MAIIHRAEVRPTKPELLAAWLPGQQWYAGDAGAGPEIVGAFRLDDPDGAVGVQTLLVRAGDSPVLQAPLTYRGAPLRGAEPWLITTMEHTVLGPRWVYDAIGDPVYVATLAATILRGGRQADEYFETDEGPDLRAATTLVCGSGSSAEPVSVGMDLDDLRCAADGGVTECTLPDAEVAVRRVLDSTTALTGDDRLTGTWPGQDKPVLLATARRR